MEEELKELKADEVLRLVQLMEHLTFLRAQRPPMWRSFMSALLRSRQHWPGECIETLPLLTAVLRRNPFQALVPPELIAHAARHVGQTISAAEPNELASMLLSLDRLMSCQTFRKVLWDHAGLLQGRLLQPEPVLLCSLARGSTSSKEMPSWWRRDVLRPWACQLRRLWSILNDRSRPTQRANYAAELAAFQMADVGLVWQEPLLRAMGIPCAPQSFANSAARVILRQRRKTDASSPWSLRALGFLEWQLPHSTGRKLIFTDARNMHPEADADQLLSVDLGYKIKERAPYKRHGDVERVALLEILQRCKGQRVTSGTVDLFVDRAICLSCLGVLAQFRSKLPEIQVRIASFGPSCFSRQPLPWHLGGRLLRDDAMDTSLATEDHRFDP
eukprot:symbB.v1.2.032689.t1/scaffold3956.1/size49429/2